MALECSGLALKTVLDALLQTTSSPAGKVTAEVFAFSPYVLLPLRSILPIDHQTPRNPHSEHIGSKLIAPVGGLAKALLRIDERYLLREPGDKNIIILASSLAFVAGKEKGAGGAYDVYSGARLLRLLEDP